MSTTVLEDLISGARMQPSLVNSVHLPVWLVDNPYILSWCRKPGLSHGQCVLSVLQLHNQTLNIWTHLGGLALFWYKLFYAFPGHLTDPIDNLFLGGAYFGIGMSFLCSVLYHVFNCGSFESSRFLSQVDYFGIILHLIGNMLALVHFAFYQQVPLRMAYTTLYLLLGVVCLAMNYHCMFSSVTNKMDSVQRSAFFIFVVTLSLPPQIYIGYLYGWALSVWALFSDVLYLTGAIVYSTKWPEKCSPGSFDLCNSHTIFHVFIIAAGYTTSQALTILSQLSTETQ